MRNCVDLHVKPLSGDAVLATVASYWDRIVPLRRSYLRDLCHAIWGELSVYVAPGFDVLASRGDYKARISVCRSRFMEVKTPIMYYRVRKKGFIGNY